MGNSGKHRKKRVPLTAQLVPGDDDDIIAWLNTIESGRRAASIKNAVRVGIGLRPKEMPAESPSHLVTQDDLDRFKKQIDSWAGDVTDYLQREMKRMLSDMAASGQIAQVPEVTDGSKIDDQRRQKRGGKIKAAQW